MTRVIFSLISASFVGIGLTLPVYAQTLNGKVVSVGDGDTIRVSASGKTLTVRLGCIDAPEIAQKPYGEMARAALQKALPTGQPVTLQVVDQDRYGRTVAKVFKGNVSVNLELVQSGNAVVYRQYLKGCPELEQQLNTAEQFAKLQRLGFWNQSSPVMPWDFRHAGKSPGQPKTTTAKPKIPQSASQGMPACVKSDCNCSDFNTQVEAQRVFNAYPGDPFRLDADKDGVACESLP